MRTVCCVCGKQLGLSSDSLDVRIISHSYCESCAHAFLYQELGIPLHEFLDSIDAPILLIEPGPRVRTANKQACSLLAKDLSEIQGHRGGEIIECIHSRTAGGCGDGVHCEACTIRKTVLETFITGKCFENVIAYPDVYVGAKEKNMCLQISTEKVDGIVLLRIDDMRERSETK